MIQDFRPSWWLVERLSSHVNWGISGATKICDCHLLNQWCPCSTNFPRFPLPAKRLSAVRWKSTFAHRTIGDQMHSRQVGLRTSLAGHQSPSILFLIQPWRCASLPLRASAKDGFVRWICSLFFSSGCTYTYIHILKIYMYTYMWINLGVQFHSQRYKSSIPTCEGKLHHDSLPINNPKRTEICRALKFSKRRAIRTTQRPGFLITFQPVQLPRRCWDGCYGKDLRKMLVKQYPPSLNIP